MPIILYGTGTLSGYLLRNTKLSACNIVQVVDGNKTYQGRKLGGWTISAPEVLTEKAFCEADILVVTYIHNSEILEYLRGMGLTNKIVTLPVTSKEG